MDVGKVTKLYILVLILGISKSLGLPNEVGDGIEIDARNDSKPIDNICPGINITTDLDIGKFYNGKLWYEIKKNPTEADCAKIRLTIISGSDPVQANFYFTYPNDKDYVSLLGNNVNNDTEIPYVTVPFLSDSYESLFYVLNTDYENYALAYSCSSDFEDHSQDRIWILSRTEEPENNTLIEDAIKEQSEEFKQKLSNAQGCEEIHENVVSCRNLTNKPGLSLEKFIKETWFEQLRSYNDWENDSICANVSFVYDTTSMKISYEASGQVQHYEAFKVKTSDNELIFENSDKTYYYINDTDYDNYAVIYSCTQESRSKIHERLWLLGQYEEINSQIIDRVNIEFGDLLQSNISCPVPQAPSTTTTTIATTKSPGVSKSTDKVPATTTVPDSNSTKPEDRPPAYTYPGYDSKFYYLFQLETYNKTGN